MILRFVICATVFLLLSSTAVAIDWPSEPHDSAQPIGNSWGEFQDYGGWSYLHPGIDIMGEPFQAVYAVASGWVKAVLTTSEELHWRVAVGESSGPGECDGWLYAHLDRFSITVEEGDWVAVGELLGYLVAWPVADFHHLHFAKIRHSGITWTPDWEFIQNPLVELSNIDDFDAPVFLQTAIGRELAFCENETSNYFYETDSLYGDVDIIARVYDKIGHPTWRCTPYRLDYIIKSDTLTTDTLLSFMFEGELFWSENVSVIYKDDGILNTEGDYSDRDYYFILTNSDGDSVVEELDAERCWHTGEFPNDYYTVVVKASDAYGNASFDSTLVRTMNYHAFDGTVTTSDSNPDSSGAVVTITAFGLTDSCDNSGSFSFDNVPAGSHSASFSKVGYESLDSLISFFEPVTLNIVLDPASYISGDADGSGDIDIDDVVFLIAYIFSGGPAPVPYISGDADSSGFIDIDDVVYLIEYIFGGGQPPVE